MRTRERVVSGAVLKEIHVRGVAARGHVTKTPVRRALPLMPFSCVGSRPKSDARERGSKVREGCLSKMT